jgi:hypothetical protein
VSCSTIIPAFGDVDADSAVDLGVENVEAIVVSINALAVSKGAGCSSPTYRRRAEVRRTILIVVAGSFFTLSMKRVTRALFVA